MTEDVRLLRDLIPKRVRLNYDLIRELNTFKSGVLDTADIKQLELLLNDSQPASAEEEVMRTTLQFLYRRNPPEFYRFLTKSKLYHLVLWTEAKRISRHLRLNNLIYIRWNGQTNQYECEQHSNYGKQYDAHDQSQDQSQEQERDQPQLSEDQNDSRQEPVRNRSRFAFVNRNTNYARRPANGVRSLRPSFVEEHIAIISTPSV